MKLLPDQNDTFCRPLFFLLAASALLIFFWGIWSLPILAHNEARRMVVVQEMLASHDWLIPTKNGEIYLAKPPLLYWIAALSCTLFASTAEWAMRLPSGLYALAVLLLVYSRAKGLFGSRPALFAVAILISSESFIAHARSAQIGTLQTLCCSAAYFFYFDYLRDRGKKYLLLSFGALGCAVLAKGPVSLVFFFPFLLILGLVNRDGRTLRGLVSLPGWLIMLAVSLSWFAMAAVELGPDGFLAVIREDMAGKIVGESIRSPLYKYPLHLLGAFAPWFLVLFYRFRKELAKIYRLPEGRYFLFCAVVPLIVMSLVSEKHGKYILPLFPALSVVLGVWCNDFFLALEKRKPHRTPRLVLGGIAVLLCGHFLFYAAVEPRLYAYRYSAFNPLKEAVDKVRGEEPLYGHNSEYIQFIYYWGAPIPVKRTEEIRGMLARGERFFLISSSKHFDALAAEDLCLVTEIKPFLKRDRSVRLLASGPLCRE